MKTRKMHDEIVDYFMACWQDSGDWNIDGLIDDIDNKYPDLTLPWLKPWDSCELGLLGFRRYAESSGFPF